MIFEFKFRIKYQTQEYDFEDNQLYLCSIAIYCHNFSSCILFEKIKAAVLSVLMASLLAFDRAITLSSSKLISVHNVVKLEPVAETVVSSENSTVFRFGEILGKSFIKRVKRRSPSILP